MTIPPPLHSIAVISLMVAFVCAAVIVFHLLSAHGQRMWIMNVVWPITALYSGPVGLWAYFRIGKLSETGKKGAHGEDPGKRKPFWQIAAVAGTHCGAGCTLSDIIAEWFIFAVPVSLFGQKIFGAWALDFAAAYLIGILFQYFTIAPMRGLGLKQGLIAAVKADSLSLIAWQIGMYGWMAVVHFGILGRYRRRIPCFGS